MKKPIVTALTGPESCGKSTLAKQLAIHFDAPLITEYAREYLEKTKGKYQFEDLEKIAKGQVKLLEEAISKTPKLIITDTELTVIKNWSEFKYGKTSDWIQKQYEKQEIDLYLLCSPDLPWEDDPLRESKNDREDIFDLYVKELSKMKRKFEIVTGIGKTRLVNTIAFLKSHIK